MSQEKASAASPFSALSYQEQQNRWLEWRSRQLDYRPVPEKAPMEQEKPSLPKPGDGLPLLKQPNMRLSAPVQHRELDQVLSRHRQAARRAGAFQTTAID